MKKISEVAVGWADTSISALVHEDVSIIEQFSFVLVSMIDSISELPSSRTATAITATYPRCWFLGMNLVIPGNLIAEVTRNSRLFGGFDEVWCYNVKPTTPKPPSWTIVAPVDLETDDLPSELLGWMIETDCSVGFGDGIGLNYVVRLHHIDGVLEKLIAEE